MSLRTGMSTSAKKPAHSDTEESEQLEDETVGSWQDSRPVDVAVVSTDQKTPGITKNNRVFITHGANRNILTQLKEIVQFGRFDPVVAVENETASKPVPEKVMDDMRSCFAAIIHVAGEKVLVDEDGKPQRKINENVLIEIGAAMALYGRNFILLVENGTELPSNLQGLYQCRYEGNKLDMEATMKLLKAFNAFTQPGGQSRREA
jgi:predicted nucleotide-binding protein